MKTRQTSGETLHSDFHQSILKVLVTLYGILVLTLSHGHFYTIPTKSEIVADGQDGLWLTQFKGGEVLVASV